MGSFNMTCFASHRTISYKNKALIIPIHQQATYSPVEISMDKLKLSQNGFSNTTCSPDAFWSYAGPIIEGTYDDYGQFNLTQSASNESNIVHFFNILHARLFKVAEGKNSAHDLPFDFQSIYDPSTQYSFTQLLVIWDKMWLVGQENRLFLNVKDSARQLQFSLLHYKSYQFFTKNMSFPEYDGKDLDDIFKKFVKSNMLFLLRPLQSMDKNPDNYTHEKENFDYGISLLGNLQGMDFGKSFQHWEIYNNSKELKDIILKFHKKNPGAQTFNKTTLNALKKICMPALKHRILHRGLDSYHITLSPSTYGSQDYCNDRGQTYLQFIQSVNS